MTGESAQSSAHVASALASKADEKKSKNGKRKGRADSDSDDGSDAYEGLDAYEGSNTEIGSKRSRKTQKKVSVSPKKRVRGVEDALSGCSSRLLALAGPQMVQPS
jgi:hypothetical protein